jgi:flagellar hook assembly protein FlgD
VTTIQYHIAGTGWVSLNVYDISGRRVRTLVNGVQSERPEGYRVRWDGRDDAGAGVASGLYFYRMVSPGFSQTKMMLLK